MVDTDQQLAAFLRTLQTAAWVALDTEADSLHAYPEKLCLIQISTAAGDDLIDPLARIDVGAMFETLASHEIVMHGADYDLRLLNRHHQFTPRAIFDTMLAARLAGARQFGYSHLVEHHLGVPLEKGAQKANWALRPLAPRLEQYARNDTRYLKPLADRLTAELEAKGRLAWHQEACARLIHDSTHAPPPDADAVWRIRGSHVLGPPALAILRELWRWRETEALAANRPPFFIMSHEALVAIAAAAAAGRPIEPVLPTHVPDRWRASLTKAVAAGLALPPEQHPSVLKPFVDRLTGAEQKRVLELQARRDARAAALGIDPTLVANRATLVDLARNWDVHAGALMAWQREVMQP